MSPKFISPILHAQAFLLLYFLIDSTSALTLNTNFNSNAIQHSIQSTDPVSLPLILSSPSSPPPWNINQSSNEYKTKYIFKRYELLDTKYNIEESALNEIEQMIVFNMEPPSSVFDVGRVITVEDYILLEVKEVKVSLLNPTEKFRFCIQEIYIDIDAVQRIEHRKFPFCLDPGTKYPFSFRIYISELKPMLYRTSMYFIINIYDGVQLVDEKIWPREVIVKINPNHLKVVPIVSKNCGEKEVIYVPLVNSHLEEMNVQIEHTMEHGHYNQVIKIPPSSVHNLFLVPKKGNIKLFSSILNFHHKFPLLHVPTVCIEPLIIEHFDIGILNTERSELDIIIPISNTHKENIEIQTISVESSTGTVEVVNLDKNREQVLAGSYHVAACQLVVHLGREYNERTHIKVNMIYSISGSKEDRSVTAIYGFNEYRNPLSLAGHKFIDLTKIDKINSLRSNIFPIKNNLNLPLLLLRVIFDEKLFKLTWLKDRREYIYPNQQRDEFALQYIGPKNISFSPIKHMIVLEFNGFILMPIEMTVYDHTLQCVFEEMKGKCSEIGMINYGYFRAEGPKFKLFTIRNSNPVGKELKIASGNDSSLGMNLTIEIYDEPEWDIHPKILSNSCVIFLKANSYVTLKLSITPLLNPKSGEIELNLTTDREHIVKKLKFKVENGTIAIVPQIYRMNSGYVSTTEYVSLVSTFSEPYRIKSVEINCSLFKVFFNNHTEIYENQWIGLALMYSPFIVLSSSPSYSYLHNITSACCSGSFIEQYVFPKLIDNRYESNRYSYVGLKVITTTQLEANCTIVVDNIKPQFVDGDFGFWVVRGGKVGMPEKQTWRVTLKNDMDYAVKYRALFIPKSIYEDPKSYLNRLKTSKTTYGEYMLCVNDNISQKHHITPQTIKNTFNLDTIPQEVTIEPLQNGNYYLSSSTLRSAIPQTLTSGELSEYVIRAVGEGARICYRMLVTQYLGELIESYVLNDIANKYDGETLKQIIAVERGKEGEEKGNEEFYSKLSLIDFDKYCNASQSYIFLFCHQIGIQIELPTLTNNLEFPEEGILRPHSKGELVLRASNRLRESFKEFYLVFLNNVTQFEGHLMKINVTEPKIRIVNVDESKDPVEMYIMKYFKKKELAKYLQLPESEIEFTSSNFNNKAKNILPIIVRPFSESGKTASEESSRVKHSFTIENKGKIPLNITHIGFNSMERLCTYKSLSVSANVCEGFILDIGKQISVDIFVSNEVEGHGDIWGVDLYLYEDDRYYFKINVIVKWPTNGGQNVKRTVLILFASIISFIYLLLVILMFKREIEKKEEKKKSQPKTKLLSPSEYFSLGSRTEKPVRKLFQIHNEQIQSVKELHQNKLREFFNSSNESEISKKHIEEDTNNILNALKNERERESVSASEESSIDFIDLVGLNPSQGNFDDDDEEKDKEQGDSEAQRKSSLISQDEDSDVDSDFNDGDEIEYSGVKQNFGWGDQSQDGKKRENDNTSYYNVFFSQNPLKKNDNSGPFHWLNSKQ